MSNKESCGEKEKSRRKVTTASPNFDVEVRILIYGSKDAFLCSSFLCNEKNTSVLKRDM